MGPRPEERNVPTTLEREASRLFSTAVFRPVAAGAATTRADASVNRLREALGLHRTSANGAVVTAAYELMRRSYRSEYFYRNLITSKIYVGRHRAANSVLLNELRVAGSVADCVFVNGAGTVYEIKTEFDSPEKLEAQLGSYYRAFPLVNVVAHRSDVERYARILRDTPAGLISVGPREQLKVVRPARRTTQLLETRAMFNLLRAGEAAALLRDWHGRLPDVPNGRRYDEFFRLASSIPVHEFQLRMQLELKKRRSTAIQRMLLNPAHAPLRAVVVQLDPNAIQQQNIVDWLGSGGT